MKKLILVFAVLFLPLMMVLGQVTEPPENWSDVLIDPGKWFVDIGAVALLTTFLTSFLNGLLKITKTIVRQIMAWIVAIVLMFLSGF